MKLNYKEGTWFAVPLKGDGYATGLVARASVDGEIILCYFFAPKRDSIPTLLEVDQLKAADAIRVWRTSDLALCRNEWPIIGFSDRWKRSEWPMPVFIRREPVGSKAWRAYYSESDPRLLVREEPASLDSILETDSIHGTRSTEIRLTKILAGGSEQKGHSEHIPAQNDTLRVPNHPPIDGGPFRVEVLQQLNMFGSDTSKAHNFDFYLYLSSEATARAAAERVHKREFTTIVMMARSGDKWLCRASKTLVPESAPLDEIYKFFEQIVTDLRGELDGWESNVVK